MILKSKTTKQHTGGKKNSDVTVVRFSKKNPKIYQIC